MNFKNSLQDVPLVGGYYEEYLSTVDRYKNLKRPSIFCRYLKINQTASTIHPETKGSDDRYYSGIRYDNYEYTPAYTHSQVIDESQDNQEKIGRKFSSGQKEVIIYTIDEPNHNDLVMFPYSPNDSTSCYRVAEVSTHLSGIHKDIKYTKLALERAPVDHTKLKLLNGFVYLMPQEHYVPIAKYVRIMKEYEMFTIIFKLLKPFFSEKHELYYYNYQGQNISPLKVNKIIYNFLTSRRHNTRYFTDVKIPFGVKDFTISDNDDSGGFDIITNKKIEMGEINNPIILGYLSFLNQMTFQYLPFKSQYYYFVNGMPEYGLDIPKEYTDNIEKYQINPETLLMDLGALIPHFKG